MNRVETAIHEGRCLIAFGARALAEGDTLGELRIRSAIPAVVLSGEAKSPATLLSAERAAHAIREGGLIVLVEPEAADAAGLNELNAMVQAAAQKPRLMIVARAFSPFSLPMALRLLKLEHEKKKAKEFLQSLPVVAPTPVVVAKVEEPKKKSGGAPRVQFVGREEERATLAELLGNPGPVVVCGPHGIGKRWLAEKVLADAGLTRLPDFSVGWGCEADALFARIALLGEDVGEVELANALRSPATRPVPVDLVALAIKTLGNAALAGRVMVIDRLEHSLRRDGTFHREGRMELLLKALLLGSYALHVVFLSTVQPRFYREGEGAKLPILPLGGLKGKELHEIFDAYRVEDFARDNFGPIFERIHGHPLAARLFAVAVRDPATRDELMEQNKFMAMDSADDAEKLRRRIERTLAQLGEGHRKALFVLAHFRLPVRTADFDGIHVDRQTRLDLLAAGLLCQRDAGTEKLYSIHPLVHAALDVREEYELLEYLGDEVLKRALPLPDKSLEKLALAQEGNRLLFAARKVRNRWKLPFPDNDPSLESLRGLIRSKSPRLDLAEQRLNETLATDPANPELMLMRADLLIAQNAGADKIVAAFAAAEAHPTPEVFHQQANWNEKAKGGRGKAAVTLTRAAEVFPESGRIRRRLAGVLISQNNLDAAIESLKTAQALEPMMPDTYGLLGEVYLHRGAYDLAEQQLSEARRLDPDNGHHLARLGALMVERGGFEDEARKTEANEILQAAVQNETKGYLAHYYLGRFLRLTGGDLEQATWALRKASKLDERAALPLVELALIAVAQSRWADAQRLNDDAVRLDAGCHEAFFARGAILEAQGYIFPAVPEYQKAVERSQPGTVARARYDEAIVRCTELISSGAAIEMQKIAEAAAPVEVVAPTGERRNPGSTSRRRPRRRGKGGGEAAEVGGGAAPDTTDDGAAAGASDAAEASPSEAPAEPEPAAEGDTGAETPDASEPSGESS